MTDKKIDWDFERIAADEAKQAESAPYVCTCDNQPGNMPNCEACLARVKQRPACANCKHWGTRWDRENPEAAALETAKRNGRMTCVTLGPCVSDRPDNHVELFEVEVAYRYDYEIFTAPDFFCALWEGKEAK